MKYVIYKSFKGYCVTSEKNYKSRISNAREIKDCSAFDSSKEIIDYFCKYFNLKEDDFIIVNS